MITPVASTSENVNGIIVLKKKGRLGCAPLVSSDAEEISNWY